MNTLTYIYFIGFALMTIAFLITWYVAWRTVEERNAAIRNLKMMEGAWEAGARFHLNNTTYYQGLLDACALHLGDEVFIQDDGGRVTEPLRAKVPELVAKLAKERTQYQDDYHSAVAQRQFAGETIQRAEHERNAASMAHAKLLEELSEVVSDRIDPAGDVEWMRGSPNLPLYIKDLEAQQSLLGRLVEAYKSRGIISTTADGAELLAQADGYKHLS